MGYQKISFKRAVYLRWLTSCRYGWAYSTCGAIYCWDSLYPTPLLLFRSPIRQHSMDNLTRSAGLLQCEAFVIIQMNDFILSYMAAME